MTEKSNSLENSLSQMQQNSTNEFENENDLSKEDSNLLKINEELNHKLSYLEM